METTALKRLLDRIGMSNYQLGKASATSAGRISMLVAGQWFPARASGITPIATALTDAGATARQIDAALKDCKVRAGENTKNKTPGASGTEGLSAARKSPATTGPTKPLKGPADMLLQKQTLTPAARKHFGLFRDPFTDDLTEAADVFLSPDSRYVRESLWAVVKHGGMLGMTGESGSGKSTLRKELLDRIARENANVIVIEPYVLAMEENDMKGKTLKSAAIAEAIITAVSPLEKPKRSAEARFAQLHRLLKESHRSGNKHALVIEEAHCLPTATLKHLKRFFELEDGFKKLLSIILIGQPELRMKLSEKNAEVREVVQRCEVVELPPLDNNLAAYLEFKFRRVGADSASVLETGAVDALRTKLTFNDNAGRQRGLGGGKTVSLLYPLAVANVLCAAMNSAAAIGAPKVDADIIKEV